MSETTMRIILGFAVTLPCLCGSLYLILLIKNNRSAPRELLILPGLVAGLLIIFWVVIEYVLIFVE